MPTFADTATAFVAPERVATAVAKLAAATGGVAIGAGGGGYEIVDSAAGEITYGYVRPRPAGMTQDTTVPATGHETLESLQAAVDAVNAIDPGSCTQPEQGEDDGWHARWRDGGIVWALFVDPE